MQTEDTSNYTHDVFVSSLSHASYCIHYYGQTRHAHLAFLLCPGCSCMTWLSAAGKVDSCKGPSNSSSLEMTWRCTDVSFKFCISTAMSTIKLLSQVVLQHDGMGVWLAAAVLALDGHSTRLAKASASQVLTQKERIIIWLHWWLQSTQLCLPADRASCAHMIHVCCHSEWRGSPQYQHRSQRRAAEGLWPTPGMLGTQTPML